MPAREGTYLLFPILGTDNMSYNYLIYISCTGEPKLLLPVISYFTIVVINRMTDRKSQKMSAP